MSDLTWAIRSGLVTGWEEGLAAPFSKYTTPADFARSADRRHDSSSEYSQVDLVRATAGGSMSQGSLFESESKAKPVGDQWTWLRVLITVKAAPNPSDRYGETVCIAGLSLDLDRPGWVRLYPINFRELDSDQQFRKYDIVSLRAKPARNDRRVESWRPDMTSLQREAHLPPWTKRRPHIEPDIRESMCSILANSRNNEAAKSLASVRPASVIDIDIKPHPGWTPAEQHKIDTYVGQLDLGDSDRTPLEAPRFKGWYRYRCVEQGCREHRQGILDWEFVRFQRRYASSDDAALKAALRAKFLDEMCGPANDVAFYVGNQAKREHVFSVLGVYYPKR